MWYEILPTFGIIFAAMAAPSFIASAVGTWAIGKPYKREMAFQMERLYYFRDYELTGNVYKPSGLEAIKSEPEEKSEKTIP